MCNYFFVQQAKEKLENNEGIELTRGVRFNEENIDGLIEAFRGSCDLTNANCFGAKAEKQETLMFTNSILLSRDLQKKVKDNSRNMKNSQL